MAVTEARQAPLRINPAGARRGASVLALAGMEARSGLRGTAFRFAGAIAFVVGWAAGGYPGAGVSLSAWSAGEAAWRYMGFVVIVWMSVGAVRDSVSRTDALVLSKPQPTERLVLSRFLGAYVQLLLALAAMFLGAILGHLYAGGGLRGFPAYGLRFASAAGVVFFVAAASYSLALLARTPLAGAVVGLYWIMTLAGKSFLAKLFFPAYTQNLPIYITLGAFLLGLACLLYRRNRRGAAHAALWARLAAPVSFALCAWAIVHSVVTGHDPQVRLQPALELMSEQQATLGEIAPGFRLPDQSGKLVSLADFPGRILVIALWSPNEPDSVSVLAQLEEVRQKYGARGVQPIAICLSEDVSAASVFARGEDIRFPIVQDWGTHNSEKPMSMSPLATAYDLSVLPHVAITDRRRFLRDTIAGLYTYEGPRLGMAIDERLAHEPE